VPPTLAPPSAARLAVGCQTLHGRVAQELTNEAFQRPIQTHGKVCKPCLHLGEAAGQECRGTRRQRGFDHRIGHCGVLHMTVESMHASCLRCLGLPKRELGGSTP